MDRTCEAFRDDLDLAALGTLTPGEEARVRAHATICPSCRVVLLAAEEVAAGLGRSVPLVAAPRSLRERVIGVVRAAPAVTSLPAPVSITSGRAARPWPRLPAPAGAIAAALLIATPIAGLAVWNASIQREMHTLREDQADIQRQVEVQRRTEDLLLLSFAPAVQANFQPVSDVRGTVGAASWNPEWGQCVVVFRNLPPPEPGANYRLWYIVDDQIERDAGIVVPEADGRAAVWVDASRWRGRDYELLLRLEHTSKDPTAPVVLRATLRRP